MCSITAGIMCFLGELQPSLVVHVHKGNYYYVSQLLRNCMFIELNLISYNMVQSINQISVAPISLAKPGSVVQQPYQVFNCKIDETVPWHQWAVGCAVV